MAIQRLFRAVASCSLLLLGIIPARPSDQLPDLDSLSDTDLKTLTVRLERIACYGTCPAYMLTIHGDGRVEYEGKRNVKLTGTQESQVEPDEIKALAKEFAKAKFLTTSEDYSGTICHRYCFDMATAVMELTLKQVSHRVKHYYGCGDAPQALFELESAIDRVAKVERWTGDVSKAGPFGTTCFDRN